MRQSHKTVFLWLTLIFAFVVIWRFLNEQRAEERHLVFSAFIQDIDQHPEKFKPGCRDTDSEESGERRVPRSVRER